MSNPCADKGYDYDCFTPTPRSSFFDGPLCAAVSQWLYDPANCDPGYWCGCSSILVDECLPTNEVETNWIGHFTTMNKTSGEMIVLEGSVPYINNAFNRNMNLTCREGFYCPGLSDAGRCVDLCPPKSICENPGQALSCPDGKYCPIATTVPMDCQGLQSCSEEGLRRFNYSPAMGAIFVVLIIAVAHLYVARCFVVRRARKDKENKLWKKEKRTSTGRERPEGDNDEDFVDAEGTEQVEAKSVGTAPDMTIDIEFEDLSLTIPNVGTIMHGVSGSLKHGKLTAIMGPSGSGKTTFLNLMSGKVDRTGGTLKVNGEETELTRYRKVIGFVPQEDVMVRNLTVDDNVRHSALMRLPTDWPKKDKLDCVNETLESLEIDHVRDSIIGDEHRRGISGGQRKRVNIALEVVMKPSLLCLDEPTSGLDSTTSLTVLQSLKDMAQSGVNVIAVLHQPKYEIFQLFDHVLFLGKGGVTMYNGEREGLMDYFNEKGFPLPEFANPPDYYMDVLSGIIPCANNPDFTTDDLVESWMCAPQNPNAVSPGEAKEIMEEWREEKTASKKGFFRWCSIIKTNLFDLCTHLCGSCCSADNSRKTPGAFKQFLLLFKRTYLQRIRNPHGTLLTIILMILAGSLIANLVPKDTILYNGIPLSLQEGGDPFWDAYLHQNVTPVDQVPKILSSVYFFLLIVSCLSVNVFGRERPVFFRETATGQSVVAYWAAKTLETLLWIPGYGAAFVLLGYMSEAWFLQKLVEYWTFFFLCIMGFYGFGMVASLLVGVSSAALLALVFGIIVIIFFGGTTGEAPSLSKAFFVFWSTQGLSTNEYDIYRYAFDVDQLNANSDTDGADELGSGQAIVGEGVGSNFDLDAGFSKNAGFCFLTAFAWHLIVLWSLKTRHHKKQR